jgi:hypothetical protein
MKHTTTALLSLVAILVPISTFAAQPLDRSKLEAELNDLEQQLESLQLKQLKVGGDFRDELTGLNDAYANLVWEAGERVRQTEEERLAEKDILDTFTIIGPPRKLKQKSRQREFHNSENIYGEDRELTLEEIEAKMTLVRKAIKNTERRRDNALRRLNVQERAIKHSIGSATHKLILVKHREGILGDRSASDDLQVQRVARYRARRDAAKARVEAALKRAKSDHYLGRNHPTVVSDLEREEKENVRVYLDIREKAIKESLSREGPVSVIKKKALERRERALAERTKNQ